MFLGRIESQFGQFYNMCLSLIMQELNAFEVYINENCS